MLDRQSHNDIFEVSFKLLAKIIGRGIEIDPMKCAPIFMKQIEFEKCFHKVKLISTIFLVRLSHFASVS
jgi:hypothetical protein